MHLHLSFMFYIYISFYAFYIWLYFIDVIFQASTKSTQMCIHRACPSAMMRFKVRIWPSRKALVIYSGQKVIYSGQLKSESGPLFSDLFRSAQSQNLAFTKSFSDLFGSLLLKSANVPMT